MNEKLIPPKLTVPVKHRGHPLGDIPVFVDIRREGSNAGNGKIERGDFVSQFFEKGEHVPAQAAVDMKPEVLVDGQFSDFRDRIDDAVRVGDRRGRDHDRIRGDCLLHCLHIRSE